MAKKIVDDYAVNKLRQRYFKEAGVPYADLSTGGTPLVPSKEIPFEERNRERMRDIVLQARNRGAKAQGKKNANEDLVQY